jgi:acyl carrier protein
VVRPAVSGGGFGFACEGVCGVIGQQVKAIWARELKLAQVGGDEDFFDLGGHSLIMQEIQAAIKNEVGVEVPMDELFRHATVNEITAHIEARTTPTPA